MSIALHHIARQLGLQVAFSSDIKETKFQNKTIWIPVTATDIFDTERHIDISIALAHELGHYLVAPKGRRARRDYGIPKQSLKRKNNERWDFDEYKASVIENELLKLVGITSYKNSIKSSIGTLTPRQALSFKDKITAWWDTEGKSIVQNVKATL